MEAVVLVAREEEFVGEGEVWMADRERARARAADVRDTTDCNAKLVDGVGKDGELNVSGKRTDVKG